MNGIMLRLLEHLHQKVDHKLIIFKYLDGTLNSWLLLDKLGQILKGIPNYKALGLIVGGPCTVVLSIQDNLHTIYIQDH